MILTPVEAVPGAWVVDPELVEDERGWFARLYGAEEFARAGLDPTITQTSASYNHRAGTLRGMHFQRDPHGEVKLIRCTRGRVFDVMVDARPDSPGFGRWAGFELDPAGARALYLPIGVAHGFVTLEDGTELSYQISAAYEPAAAVGFRWDDPEVAIAWPLTPTVVSERDRALPPLSQIVQSSEETR